MQVVVPVYNIPVLSPLQGGLIGGWTCKTRFTFSKNNNPANHRSSSRSNAIPTTFENSVVPKSPTVWKCLLCSGSNLSTLWKQHDAGLLCLCTVLHVPQTMFHKRWRRQGGREGQVFPRPHFSKMLTHPTTVKSKVQRHSPNIWKPLCPKEPNTFAALAYCKVIALKWF